MKIICFVLAAAAAVGVEGASLFLEAERFDDRGGWTADSQFYDLMGSTYLLAHGLGRPVRDACTEATIGKAGRFRVLARTCNWSAHWSEHPAGTFLALVNGKRPTGGQGVLGTGSARWGWQDAGEVELEAGRAKVALRDLTGFEGRCDAVALVEEADWRANRGRIGEFCDGMRPAPADGGTVRADFVVCGGGIAGTCAAISAARLGLKVALVQDRPVLGGVNSSEIRVHMCGGMNFGRYPRLGDVVAEIAPREFGIAYPAERYEDGRKLAAVEAEKNIRLFLNTRAVRCEKRGGRIAAVYGRNVLTGAETRFEAPYFADCTGDCCIGAMAGAELRYGREARGETGESEAPERADGLTLGTTVTWYTKEDGEESEFPVRPWMLELNEENCLQVTRGDWYWETGMTRDMIRDAEAIRDYGMMSVYSNWAHIKSRSAHRGRYARRSLAWMAFVAGKRESRRMVGDVTLRQQDIMEARDFPDATCEANWSIDIHLPRPEGVSKFAGEPFCSVDKHLWHDKPAPIPYRCFYSRNVDNLFMAGRNISVTHVALGSTRVMRTTGMMGEVVGMAASVCKEEGCLPRGVYEKHLGRLKELMARGVGRGEAQPPQDYNIDMRNMGRPKR